MANIFPWVEEELEALQLQQNTCENAQDFALSNFLKLLIYLREVLVQDLALLIHQVPRCPIFSYPPFNLPAFRDFASRVPSQISLADDQARAALQNLPENLANSFSGIVKGLHISYENGM